MKQISKIFFGLLFGLGFILVPSYRADAQMQTMESGDLGGGGGGGGGTTTAPAPVVHAGAISLVVNLDHPSYSLNAIISVATTASVDTCTNTITNLVIKGSVLNSGVAPTTIINQNVTGGNSIAQSTSFMAPSVAGDYTLRIEATDYLLGDYYLTDNYGQNLVFTNHVLNMYGSYTKTIIVTTNTDGKVMDIHDEYNNVFSPSILSNSDVLYDPSINQRVTASQHTGQLLRTMTMDIPFTVVAAAAPTVTVTADQSVLPTNNTGTTIRVRSTNANSCTRTDDNGTTTPVAVLPTDAFNTYHLDKTTTYTVTCSN